MQAPVGIVDYLVQIRRRRLLVHLVRDTGVLLGAVALALLGLVLMSALFEGSRVALRFVLAGLAALALTTFVFRLVVVARRLRHPGYVAQIVGQRCPTLRSDLLSAIELSEELDSGVARFSGALFTALVEHTRLRLTRLQPSSVVPSNLLRSTALLLSLTAVGWAIFAAIAPARLPSALKSLFSLSDHDAAQVAHEPLLGDITVSYSYPRHMRRASTTVSGSTGHLSAPAGTRVELRSTALVPHASASIIIEHRGKRDRVPLQHSGKQRAVHGAFTIVDAGEYYFQIRTIDGRVLRDAFRYRIEIEPDAPPKATLYGPPDDTEVTARQRVEVGFVAEDDYGLQRVDLVYQVGSRDPERIELWRAKDNVPHRRAGDKIAWDLAQVQLEPGARVGYWIDATDNDDVSGPKQGSSSTAYLKIFSRDERHQRTLDLQRRVVERALRVLANRLLLFKAETPLAPELQLERCDVAHRGEARLLDQLRDLRNRMREDQLVPQTVLASIGKARRRLRSLVAGDSKLLRDLRPKVRKHQLRPKHLAALRAADPKVVEALEQTTLTLADLLDEQQLQSLLGMKRQLDQARERLAGLLERYKRTHDPKLKQEILREIAFMQQQLEQLLSRMAKLRATIPDEYLNLEAVKGAKLGENLQQLTEMLRRNDVQQLEKVLEQLNRSLSQLDEMLGSSLDSFRDRRMNAREKEYSALMDKLRGLEAEQRGLADRTDRVVSGYRKRAAKLLRDEVAPFVRRELSKVGKLRKELEEIDERPLAAYQREQLQRIRKRVQGLESMLKQRDLDEAMDMAKRTNNGLETLRDDLAEDDEGTYGNRRGKLRLSLRHARRAQSLAAEIERELDAIFPAPSSLLQPKDRAELRQIRQQQRRLRRAVKELSDELAKRSHKDEPMQAVGPPELPSQLGASGQLMDKAEHNIARVHPQQAASDQRAAADQLAAAQRKMRRGREPRRAGNRSPRARVKIPGADAFAPPREFRRDILDAMKELPPSAFEREVKRYYRELVR